MLANPWLDDEPDGLPPPAAIRSHYLRRLRDPAAWARAITGRVGIGSLANGLRKMLRPPVPTLPGSGVIAAVEGWGAAARVVLARSDATGLHYADMARRSALETATSVIDTASHSFARPGDQDALFAAIVAALR